MFSLGRIPYGGLDNQNLPEYLESGRRLSKPALCSEEMYAFIHIEYHTVRKFCLRISQCLTDVPTIINVTGSAKRGLIAFPIACTWQDL